MIFNLEFLECSLQSMFREFPERLPLSCRPQKNPIKVPPNLPRRVAHKNHFAYVHCFRSGPGKPNQRKVSSWTLHRGIPEQKFNVNRACFPKEKHQNHENGRNSWTYRFGPFFGLVCRGDSWLLVPSSGAQEPPQSWKKSSENLGWNFGVQPIPRVTPRVAPRIAFSHRLGRECHSDNCSENTPEFRELLREWPFHSRAFFIFFKIGVVPRFLTWSELSHLRKLSAKRLILHFPWNLLHLREREK